MRLKIIFFVLSLFIFLPSASASVSVDFTDITEEEYIFYDDAYNTLKPYLEEKDLFYYIIISNSFTSTNRKIGRLVLFNNSDFDKLEIQYFDNSYFTFYNNSSEDIIYKDCVFNGNSDDPYASCLDTIDKFGIYKSTLNSNSYLPKSYGFGGSILYLPYYISNDIIPLNYEGSITVNYDDVTYKKDITTHNLFYKNHFSDDSGSTIIPDDTKDSFYYIKGIFFLLLIFFVCFILHLAFKFLRFLLPI